VCATASAHLSTGHGLTLSFAGTSICVLQGGRIHEVAASSVRSSTPWYHKKCHHGGTNTSRHTIHLPHLRAQTTVKAHNDTGNTQNLASDLAGQHHTYSSLSSHKNRLHILRQAKRYIYHPKPSTQITHLSQTPTARMLAGPVSPSPQPHPLCPALQPPRCRNQLQTAAGLWSPRLQVLLPLQ
jgi:hypothetical protein